MFFWSPHSCYMPRPFHFSLFDNPTLLHCSTLYYTARHYTTLHYTTLHYTSLQYTILHYTALQHTALHRTARHYTTLHHTAQHYTTLHCTAVHYTTLHYTTLHCTALHYITLHCTILHYSTRYHGGFHMQYVLWEELCLGNEPREAVIELVTVGQCGRRQCPVRKHTLALEAQLRKIRDNLRIVAY